VVEAFAARVSEAVAAGGVHADIHPYAAAAAMAAILERLAAYHIELEGFGMTRDDLVQSCARILVQTLTGASA
jgi:hypothetical protein